jgi:hypothetical protein
MSDFQALANDLKKIDSNKILRDIFSDTSLQKWILDQPKNRIQRTGINSDGNKLQTDSSSSGNPYADTTMDLKERLGQTNDHVTLTDTGDFWDSFRFKLEADGFEIIANFIKNGEHIGVNFLQDYTRAEFFETITSLSESEENELIMKIFDKYIQKIDEVLQD